MTEAYEVGQVLYRVTIPQGATNTVLEEWVVTRPTPKGGWIAKKLACDRIQRIALSHDNVYEGLAYLDKLDELNEKWVPFNAKFCSVTKEEALVRLSARARSYVSHCKRRPHEAERRVGILGSGVKETVSLICWQPGALD